MEELKLEMLEQLLRSLLERLAEKAGIPFNEETRNFELACALGVGDVFGCTENGEVVDS